MASGGKGNQGAQLQQQATTTANAVTEVDELEKLQREELKARHRLRMGEAGAVDVRKIPGAGIGVSLFEDAKKVKDAGRKGVGLNYGEGNNPMFSAALSQEQGFDRELRASGMLEDYVSNLFAGDDIQMGRLASAGDSRRLNRAQMAQSQLNSYESNKRPGFLHQAALGLIGGVSTGIKIPRL